MKTPILFLSLVTFSAVQAQEFKEGIIFDLHGPVKEVLLDNEIYGIRGMGFSPNGKCKPSIMRFDDNGYPLDLSLSFRRNPMSQPNELTQVSFVLSYDDNHRVAATTLDFPVSPYIGKEVRIFSYGNTPETMNVLKTMTLLVTDNNSESKTDYAYSDYKYDDYGNWVSRNVTKTMSFDNDPVKSNTSEYTETRTISYYDVHEVGF